MSCREENGFAICFLVPDGKKEPANNSEVGMSIAVRNVLEHPRTKQPYLEVMYQDHSVSVLAWIKDAPVSESNRICNERRQESCFFLFYIFIRETVKFWGCQINLSPSLSES